MARHARTPIQQIPWLYSFNGHHHGQVVRGDVGATRALADDEGETAIVIRDSTWQLLRRPARRKRRKTFRNGRNFKHAGKRTAAVLNVDAEKVNANGVNRLEKLEAYSIEGGSVLLQLRQQLLHVEIGDLLRLGKRIFELHTTLLLERIQSGKRMTTHSSRFLHNVIFFTPVRKRAIVLVKCNSDVIKV